MKKLRAVFLAAFYLSLSTPVFAALPLATDDTGTQGMMNIW